MLKQFSGTTLHIGFSVAGIALVRSSGWLRSTGTIVAEKSLDIVDDGFEQMALQLRTILMAAECADRTANLVVADHWVRLFMVTAPKNTAGLQDIVAATNMRFYALYGDQASDWKIEADWNANRPFVACAMPRKLLEQLIKVADECKVIITGITPHFIAQWNRWNKRLRPSDWLGVMHENCFTLGILVGANLHAIRSCTVADGSWSDIGWLPELVNREALRLNVDAPQRIQLCGFPTYRAEQQSGSLDCIYLEDSQFSPEKLPSSAVMLAYLGMHR